jgi:predicted transcriptional regulator
VDVRKRHRAKQTLQAIADATGLSVRTVRTIIAGKKRETTLRRQTFDRQRTAAYRARKRERDQLPKAIDDLQKAGQSLIKQAKGLGKS